LETRTVRGNKREAQRALSALVTQVSAGKISSSMTTLSQLLVQWLDLVSAQLAATTVREYQRLVATRLAPDLGHLALRRITTQRLDSYYAGLAAIAVCPRRRSVTIMRCCAVRSVRPRGGRTDTRWSVRSQGSPQPRQRCTCAELAPVRCAGSCS